jgi:hypothetical protein
VLLLALQSRSLCGLGSGLQTRKTPLIRERGLQFNLE